MTEPAAHSAATPPGPEPAQGAHSTPEPYRYDPDALLREYAKLTLENRDLKDRIAKNNKRLEAIEGRCTDEMERRQVRALDFIGLGNVHLRREGWAKLKGGPAGDDGKYTAAQRAAGAAALKAAGLGELVGEGFNLNSVSARFREYDKQHTHPPPALEEAFDFDREYKIGVNATPARRHAT